MNAKCPMSDNLERYKCRVGFKFYDDYFPNVNTATLSNGVCTDSECAYCDCDEGAVTPGFSGMTGRACDIEFTRCPAGSTQTCFHGAACVEVKDTYVCVCPAATTEDHSLVTYAGEHCEYVASEICAVSSTLWDVSSSGQWFCTTNGRCRDGITTPETICRCNEGYFGLHCEFKKEPPACDVTCENGGICTTGTKDFSNYEAALATFLNEGAGAQRTSYCACPAGWTGRTCHYRVADCGSSNAACLNGASCRDGMGGVYCDCSDVDLTDAKGIVIPYAGGSCERVYTTMCGFANSGYFCTNGGTCGAELHMPCECPAGFHGPKCEFVGGTTKTCTLGCENDGVCHFGDGPESTLYDSFNLTRPDNRSGMHCLCPPGYAGYLCENAIDICGDFEHHCQNKGQCVTEGDSYKCDCNTDSSDASYAGVHCDYRATSYCVGPGASKEFFCTNEGECKELILAGVAAHPGCICNPEHYGEYCELDVKISSKSRPAYKSFVGFTITFVLAVAVALAMVWVFFIRTKRVRIPDSDQATSAGEPPEVHVHALDSDNDRNNTVYMGAGYEQEEEVIDNDKVFC